MLLSTTISHTGFRQRRSQGLGHCSADKLLHKSTVSFRRRAFGGDHHYNCTTSTTTSVLVLLPGLLFVEPLHTYYGLLLPGTTRYLYHDDDDVTSHHCHHHVFPATCSRLLLSQDRCVVTKQGSTNSAGCFGVRCIAHSLRPLNQRSNVFKPICFMYIKQAARSGQYHFSVTLRPRSAHGSSSSSSS